MKKIIAVTKDIKLIKVQADMEHIKILYNLLKYRKSITNISHNKVPNLKKHKSFVLSKPYRKWFLIENKKIILGSVYISKINTIGIHFFKVNKSILKEVLLFIFKEFKPLKKIPSVRTSHYVINISSKNQEYANIIKKIGGNKIQETYIFDNS